MSSDIGTLFFCIALHERGLKIIFDVVMVPLVGCPGYHFTDKTCKEEHYPYDYSH